MLHNTIDECKLDILAVTETWIKKSHPDAIKLDIAPPGFTVTHCHRPGDRIHDRGGVAIIARDNLRIKQVSLSGTYLSVEMLVVQCSVSVGRLNIVVIYRPPKSTKFFSELDNLLEELVTLPGHLLICGDFNSRSNNNNVDIVVQLKTSLIEHDLLQHITSPTHRLGGLLDLFITPVDQSSLVKDIDIRDMGFSDHFLIIASLNVHVAWPSCSTSMRRNFRRRIDENIFRQRILASSVFVNPKLNTNDFTNQLIDDLVTVLDELAPYKKSTRRCGSTIALAQL